MSECGLAARLTVLREKYVPKRFYWDVFKREIYAATVNGAVDLQFRDLTCEDGPQLNYDDARHFTNATGSYLRKHDCL